MGQCLEKQGVKTQTIVIHFEKKSIIFQEYLMTNDNTKSLEMAGQSREFLTIVQGSRK